MFFQKKLSIDSIGLIGVVALLTASLYARDLFGVSISKLIIVALAVLPAIVLSYRSLVYLIFFLFPLTSGIPGNYIFPLLIILLLIKKRESFDINSMICFFCVVFMEIIHYGFYDFNINWASTLGYICNLFFLFYFISLKNNTVDTKTCILYFAIGIAVLLIAVFYITQLNGGIDSYLEGRGRLGYTKEVSDAEEGVMMLNANPNGLGFYSIIGIASILGLYSLGFINLWIMLPFSVLYLYVGAMSISRAFLIGIFAIVILFFILSSKNNRRGALGRSLLLLLFIAVAVSLLWNNTILNDAYTTRLENVAGDNAGGRIDLLSQYNSFLFDNPVYLFWGTGAVNYHRVVSTIPLATHNGLQQVMVAYGLVGFFFFMVVTGLAIKKCYKKGAPVCLIPFIVSFLYIQSGQLLNPSYNLFMFIVAFFVMKLSQDKECLQSN